MPPDNAAQFVEWLENAETDTAPLDDVSYFMLGCGNSDWAATFQEVPRKIDGLLRGLGAKQIIASEELDARADIDTQFHTWLDALMPQLGEHFDLDLDTDGSAIAEPLYSVEITKSITANAVADRVGTREVTLVSSRELKDVSQDEGRSTRHIEVELPEGMEYEPGDHLCVVPVNNSEVVERLLDRFGLDRDTYVRIETRSEMRGPFPSGSTFSVLNLAKTAGELQAVATRKDIATLARFIECPNSKDALEALAAKPGEDGTDLFASEVLEKRKSVLDILEEYPACDLPLAVFLELIPFLSPRYYSISSSPAAAPDRCSITVGVVKGPALSGKGEFKGTCSSYLAGLAPGDQFQAVVRKPTAKFRLPEDPTRPIIMIGPGTGIAPFRGFLQQRDHLKHQGMELGEAFLFFGCRHPEHDYLYREELADFHQRGIATIHAAFSRHDSEKKYVQHLIADQTDTVWDMIEAGARIYVCGDGAHMEPDVRRELMEICREKRGCDDEQAEAWIDALMDEERYLLDVWVG